MLLILHLTNDPRVMGNRANGRAIKILPSVTTAAIFAASLGLILSWLR